MACAAEINIRCGRVEVGFVCLNGSPGTAQIFEDLWMEGG
jgi:hypothetical protein